ncbi:MAG: response regulator [Pseudomonadales bacterium]|uniref:Response regulator receiver n=1 Tax=Oleiphilus messinensis TaxID=141451 RepID=A0A1Y0I4M5_9GAMM|nr:response regulator [Oleiphilus messinensis]ARU55159.1 response regulator receiver [Oleiphilus messinensis]MCG8613907.1 response regulator [Pseudomonadales bacterium]
MHAYNTTILLVEDNPDDEALALRALKKTEIQNDVIVARDGQEALDYVFAEGKFEGRDINDCPRLILLDIKLPKLSGLDVLKNIRKDNRTQLIPVVLLTSSDEARDMIEGYRSGANSFISKPVDFNEFVNQVKTLGKYWLGINKTPYTH